MVALKVEVQSREMIKPSSPTLNHLKIHKLSFLDQIIEPPSYIPLIFFYSNEPSNPIDHKKLSILLKRTLSETLVRFYPLAGRINNGKLSVDCNDQGVDYVEARVGSDLSKVIDNPKLEDTRGLLPFEPTSIKSIVLGVQVNHFSCGGVAISVCVSHKVADGTAAVDFVRAWASAALVGHEGVANNNNGNVVLVEPKFDSASQFPPRDLSGFSFPDISISKEKIVTKRFIFDKKMINVLKDQVFASSDNLVEGSTQAKAPTRVEVVSAFIWKRVMRVERAKSDLAKIISVVLHAVDLRSRRALPIPRDSFGNFCWFATATSIINEGAKHPELVGKLGEAIRKIDSHFIKTLENGECLPELKKSFENSTDKGIEFCYFSSWCRFPLYEVNFGWGKPTWVSTTTSSTKNVVILLSTKCGQGIEAWVTILEDDIAILEHDHKLLSLTTTKSTMVEAG